MSCNNCNNCSSCGCEAEDVQEIQQFVPGKEYTVGEFFKYDKIVYKVVIGDDDECGLCDLGLCGVCGDFLCTRYERSDSIDVEAIRYDSEE